MSPAKKVLAWIFGIFFGVVIIYGVFFSEDTSEQSNTHNDVKYNTQYNQFYGYDCTDDCSGHQAGWDWAENKGINNMSDCGGKSASFKEGCWAYVRFNS